MIHNKTCCFVLAAGKGKRLKPLTAFVAKPLVPIGLHVRLIDLAMLNCQQYYFDTYVLVGYKSEQIIRYIRRMNFIARILKGKPNLESGGEVLQHLGVIKKAGYEYVFVLPSDAFFNVNLNRVLEHFTKMQLDVCMVTTKPLNYGQYLVIKDDLVASISNRRTNVSPCGVHLFRVSVLEEIRKNLENSITLTDILQTMLNRRFRIGHLHSDGVFMDLGSWRRYFSFVILYNV
jgi:NDP-sugar pyrophosphorylase family protein